MKFPCFHENLYIRPYKDYLKCKNFREDLFSRNRPDTVLNKSQNGVKLMKMLRNKENLHFARIYFRELIHEFGQNSRNSRKFLLAKICTLKVYQFLNLKQNTKSSTLTSQSGCGTFCNAMATLCVTPFTMARFKRYLVMRHTNSCSGFRGS